MSFHMNREIRESNASVLTSGPMTDIPFVAGMHTHVVFQVHLDLERFSAVWPGALVVAVVTV